MTHWADRYVGLPAVGPRPCWILVRQVWIDMLGFEMPRFDETDDPERAVALGGVQFSPVPPGQEREFDAVMMLVPHRLPAAGPRAFRPVEAHIGVVAGRGLVLHVELGRTASIDPIRGQRVSRIMRGPWGGHVAQGRAQ